MNELNPDNKLRIIKTYGFIDELRGFRSITLDLYRGVEHKAYMRCSDDTEHGVIDKLYDKLYRSLYISICKIYNEGL